MTRVKRLAILASGRGSNMLAISDACQRGELDAEIAVVVTNEPNAGVLEIAKNLSITTACIPHREFPDRESFELALLDVLRPHSPDLVILAGFMRILTERFIREYYGSLLNIHPSLLPKYPGLDTHQRAIDAGDSEAGATVHFVIPELDAGPAIAQVRVPILESDTADDLAKRVIVEEHRLYPHAVKLCLEGKARLLDGKMANGELIEL